MNERAFYVPFNELLPDIYLGEWVKGALCPSNAKRLYMDEKSTEKWEIRVE